MDKRVLATWTWMFIAPIPLALFAYLGHFSRMMADDYCHVFYGQELGALGSVRYWRKIWNGSYLDNFVVGVMAPLDTLTPSFMPIIIIVLWWIGLVALSLRFLAIFGVCRYRLATAFSLSALIVAATINAFHSPMSFYWLAASMRYCLPLAVLTIYIALVVTTEVHFRSGFRMVCATVFGFAVAFAIGGFSEMYLVFQLILCTVTLFLVPVYVKHALRRKYLVFVMASWLGTIASAAIQLSSPGVQFRAASYTQLAVTPIRSIHEMIVVTMDLSFRFIGHQQALAGFILIFAVSLLASHVVYRPRNFTVVTQGFSLAKTPLMVSLIIQLLFIPILWTHTSDNIQVLGRFSAAYMSVVMINAGFVIALWSLIRWRYRVDTMVREKNRCLPMFCGSILLVLVALFVMAQLRSIHFKAATYLFTSLLTVLGLCYWQIASTFADVIPLRVRMLPFVALAANAISIAGLVATSLFGLGFVSERILAPAAYIQVVLGLVWGVYAGILLRCSRLSKKTRFTGNYWVEAVGLIVAFVIGFGILLGHGKLIPEFASYARQWDERHMEILRQRDSGREVIAVPDLTPNLARFLGVSTIYDGSNNRCAKRYYGVDSIIEAEA